jgi:hypothetical protein
LAVLLLLCLSGGQANGQGQGPKKEKKQPKQINKEARKLAGKSEQAAERIGRDAIFCLLAAHTDIGDGPELKEMFEALEDVSFGDFVAAVTMAEITEIPLEEILERFQDGMSFGDIAREAGVDMGEVHRGMADFRLEVIQTMTHPPTTDCFEEDTP